MNHIICVGSLLLICSIIDIKKKVIPVWLLVVYAILFLIQLVTDNKVTEYETYFGIVPGLLLLVISKLTRESIGYGDGMLLIVTGLFLGFSQNMGLLLLGLFLLSLFALCYLLLGKGKQSDSIPFIPFLTAAYFLMQVLKAKEGLN